MTSENPPSSARDGSMFAAIHEALVRQAANSFAALGAIAIEQNVSFPQLVERTAPFRGGAGKSGLLFVSA
jgi:hypothetical protein